MTDTPKPRPDLPPELADLMASLDADFGKKSRKASKEAPHKGLNRAWHEANPSLSKASGRAPERLNPESSDAWTPTARVTYVVRQTCACCNNTVEFIGGEYVEFKSKRQHAVTLRRAENCPNLFLFRQQEQDLEDRIDEFNQLVSRCPGCIAVERQAIEIWEAAKQQTGENPTQHQLDVGDPLNIDLGDNHANT